MWKLKIITEGMLVPWGLSWFVPHTYANLQYRGEQFLVICIRLPFYWRDRDFSSMQEVWGSAVLRWAVGFDWPKIIWVPDYSFAPLLPKPDLEIYGGE